PVVSGMGSFAPWARLCASPCAPTGAPEVKAPVDETGKAEAAAPFADAAEKNSVSILARTSACSAVTSALGKASAAGWAAGGVFAAGVLGAGASWAAPVGAVPPAGNGGCAPGSGIGAPGAVGNGAGGPGKSERISWLSVSGAA